MNQRQRLSRRSLLKALGLGPAVLPLLEAEQATGQLAAGPKRVFILAWANGMYSSITDWPAAGTDFVLPPFMSSLEPHRNELILLNGFDYDFIRDTAGNGERTGHACFQGMLTGALYDLLTDPTSANVAGGPSIDQYIGNALRDQQGFPGLAALNLGVFVRSTARLSWRAAGDAVVPNQNPFDVFDTLFAGFDPPAMVGAPVDPAVDRLRMMRQSILDHVEEDLTRFSLSVGVNDRVRIDSHLQSVRELEVQLGLAANNMPGMFELPTIPPELGAANDNLFNSTEVFEFTTQAMIDLGVTAMAADATRVVVLQLGDQGDSDLVLTSLGFVDNGQESGNTGLVQGYHVLAHDNVDGKVTMDTWFQSQVAYTIAQLKATSGGTSALIDSSALVAMNNMRTGTHETTAVPAIVAGSLGGYFQTGRSLALTGTPQNGLLIALANGMGIPTATFGDAMYGGELTDLQG